MSRDGESQLRDRIQALEEAARGAQRILRLIADAPECGCDDHSHEHCCTNAGIHCPECLARVALSRLDALLAPDEESKP